MLLRRPGYKLDINAILRACAEYIGKVSSPGKCALTECLSGVKLADRVKVSVQFAA